MVRSGASKGKRLTYFFPSKFLNPVMVFFPFFTSCGFA